MEYSVTYEDGFLVREIGSIATKAEIAITELIANGHDAGASEVRINFPDEPGGLITVEDNGMGLKIGGKVTITHQTRVITFRSH